MSQPLTPPNEKATEHDDEVDLVALLLVLLRGWKAILAATLLGALLGIAYSRYIQPTYQSDALLQIDSKSQSGFTLDSNLSAFIGGGGQSTPVQREAEIIKSRMVLKPVVEKLHLDIKLSNPEITTWDRILKSKMPTQTNTEQGVILETSYGNVQVSSFEVPLAYINQPFTLIRDANEFTISFQFNEETMEYKGIIGTENTISTPEGKIKITVNSLPHKGHPINLTKASLPNTINALTNSLSVEERGKQTSLIQLIFRGYDQNQATLILKDIIQTYTNISFERSFQKTQATLEFMESQLPQLKQKLELSEDDFNKFREQYGTIDVTQESNILISERANIEKQMSELNLKKAEHLTYYTEEHPLVIQINEQLLALNERRSQIQQDVSRLPEMQRQFIKLSQDTEINREVYLAFLKNYEQLKIQQAGEVSNIQVVDLPINTYQVVAPKKTLIWTISSLSGFLLASLLVLIRGLLHNTIRNPELLENKTGVPVIATIPRSKASPKLRKKQGNNHHLLSTVDYDGVSYEAIKGLRNSLLFSMPKTTKVSNKLDSEQSVKTGGQGKVIMITSEAPGMGKSFIASNLAEAFSQLNKKVLIIDADMRRGDLNQSFNMSESNGLSDYLAEKNGILTESIQQTSFDFIDFMSRGTSYHDSSALLSTDKLADMMLTLVSIYDFIIIDTPPILAVSDAVFIAQYSDKVLMVTRFNHSVEDQVTNAVKKLSTHGITVDGIILNDTAKK